MARESLGGLALAHPELLRVDVAERVVLRAGGTRLGKVGLVSGGGSGHEPLHAGFVGHGMLDAACVGDVFTSPLAQQVIAASDAADGGAGVLHLVQNYAGDVASFALAGELLTELGTELKVVVFDDDVAVSESAYSNGRRGGAAILLAEKIAGAAAERGDSLEDVAQLCERVKASARSIAVALSAPHVAGADEAAFTFDDDELEVGVGLHGETGRRRVALPAAGRVAELLLDPLFDELELGEGDEVLCLVSGLGGTSLMELYVVYRAVARLLEEAEVRVRRSLVGNYVTSLGAAGCSLTLLRLDPELAALWDAPVHAPALRWGL